MSDVLIRDRTGTLCSVAEARREIRRSLGDCTDEMLAANAAGQVHPSQAAGVAKYVRGQRGIVYLFMALPTLGILIVSVVFGVDSSSKGDAVGVPLVLGTTGVVACIALAVVLAGRVGHTLSIQKVHGRIDAVGTEGSASPAIAGELIPVPPRWTGTTVVAYRVKCGMTIAHYLSGDLVADRVLAVSDSAAGMWAPPIVPAVSPQWSPTVVLHGDDDVARSLAGFALAIVSTTLSVLTVISLARKGLYVGARPLALFWAVISAGAVLVQLGQLMVANRERRTTYTVQSVGDASPVLIVDRPRKQQRFALADLRSVEVRRSSARYLRGATFHFSGKLRCDISARCGDLVVGEIRRIRPDVAVTERHVSGDSGGGG
jgi:hypothetical protein